MKAFALAALLAGAALAVNPALVAVHTVYLLPMASGMDQFLAGRLTARGVLQVVADPQHADAVFTDHLGESFEDRMNELYAPPKKAEQASSNQYAFDAPRPPVSSFSRGRGAFFLVDRKTRAVLWSIYEQPRGTRPQQLEYTADRIARELSTSMEKARKGKR
ncbi:MAG TPA: hypothetical protein VFA04_23615 [Bryobacteraceae bacterium]|nr:hypothetical protein [Bryobacteraceae bacterium]